ASKSEERLLTMISQKGAEAIDQLRVSRVVGEFCVFVGILLVIIKLGAAASLVPFGVAVAFGTYGSAELFVFFASDDRVSHGRPWGSWIVQQGGQALSVHI